RATTQRQCIVQITAVHQVPGEDGSSVARFNIDNQNSEPLTLSEASFSGAAAGEFSVINALPFVIPANETGILEVSFAPTGQNGLRQASMALTSDDPNKPNFQVDLLARRLATDIPGGDSLFAEPFDSAAMANVIESAGDDTSVRYVDYSEFSVGGQSFSIPESPNPIDGSAATRGVLIQANLADSAATGVNLTAAASPGGQPLTFSGNYRLKFDMYLSVDPEGNANSEGITESGLWGVGADLNQRNAFSTEAFDSVRGTWGWIATELGFSTADAAIYEGPSQKAFITGGLSRDLLEPTFGRTSPIPFAPNNSWTEVDILVLNNLVSVRYNGVEFFQTTTDQTTGQALIGYEDPFTSLSSAPNFQWGLFDNFVVENGPDLSVVQVSDFQLASPINPAPRANLVLFNNREAGDITVSEATLAGADPGAFAILSSLPVVVSPQEEAIIEIQFQPQGETGIKTATVNLTTDDPNSPSVSTNIEAQAVPRLLAHFKFDDSANPPADASGNEVSGNFQEFRFPVSTGQESLTGDDGSSIGFRDDHESGTGNWANFDLIHTPTLTVSLWIQPTEGAGENSLFSRNDTVTYIDSDGVYGAFIDPDGRLIFRSRNNEVLSTSENTIQFGETYHIAVTHLDNDGFDNDTAERSRLYINGELIVEAEGRNTIGFGDFPSSAVNPAFHLASRIAAGSGYAGLVDDLQIYSVELEADQIAEIFANGGSVARFDDPNLTLNSAGDFGELTADAGEQVKQLTLANTGASETLNITTAELTGPEQDHFTFTELPDSLAPGESAEITVTFNPRGNEGFFSAAILVTSDDSGNASQEIKLSARVPKASGLLAHFPMDETEGDTMIDNSGNDYHGRYVAANGGAFTLGQTGLAGGTSVLLEDGGVDGAGYGLVESTVGLPPLQSFTLSLWMQVDNADVNTTSVIFSKGRGLGDPFALAMGVTSPEAAMQWIADESDQGVTGEVIPIGEPVHVVVTHSDPNGAEEKSERLRIYVNGDLILEEEEPDGFDDSAASPLLLGALNGTLGLTGLLDDVQIYNRELEAGEVTQLFSEPGTTLDVDGPVAPADLPQITALTKTSGEPGTLTWQSEAGATYLVEFSTDLQN
ncbi:MAG: LamG-like jellyroll fold domain-containing protein, partial [Verrucomicrobiota bacterium]